MLMPSYHVVANTASPAQNVETDLTPVNDTILPIFNTHWFPQDTPQLLWASAMSTSIARARVQTPTLLKTTSPYIRGIMGGLVPTTPAQVADYRVNPLDMRSREEIIVFGTQSNAMAMRITSLLGLLFSPMPPVTGDQYTMRGTSTTTVTANAWSLLTVVWQNQLPQGNYAVTGLQHQSTNAQAARVIFLGAYYRPGCMSLANLTDYGHPMFRLGGLGQWGGFRDNIMPNIEVLANGADAAHELYLDFQAV